MGREGLAKSPSGESPLDYESNLDRESTLYNESALNRESALCNEPAPRSESSLQGRIGASRRSNLGWWNWAGVWCQPINLFCPLVFQFIIPTYNMVLLRHTPCPSTDFLNINRYFSMRFKELFFVEKTKANLAQTMAYSDSCRLFLYCCSNTDFVIFIRSNPLSKKNQHNQRSLK